MRRIIYRYGWLFVSLLAVSLCALSDDEAPGSPARERLDNLRAQIRAAHTAGVAEAYLGKSRELEQFLHSSPGSVLQVMSAQAFGHDEDGALDTFQQFIAMGQSDPKTLENEIFAGLRKQERFKSLEAEMRKNEQEVARSSIVFELPGTGLIPEDIDYDPVAQRFYVSSVLKDEILSLDRAGHAAVFAKAPDSLPMMALKVDSRRRTLWATEVALNGFISIPKEQWRTSVILVYDLDSGHLVRRIAGPAKTTFGDMALTPGGDAIAADNDGGIYRVSIKSQRVERLDSGEFISPQTAAISGDGRIAYIPDYLRGIAMLDLRSRKVTWMDAGRHALNGIDGLYLSGRILLATQNGTAPERVIRFELDKSMTRIESESLIERATPTLGDPTHGVVVNNWFYYIANSGWDALNDDGTPKAGSSPGRSVVMRVSLN
jgi:hypothetical protein